MIRLYYKLQNKYISLGLCAVLLLMSHVSISAQTDSSETKYLDTQFSKEVNTALKSNIFSTSSFEEQVKFSEIKLNYNGEFGDFHRVQTGEDISIFGFSSEGSFITDRLYMVGSFDFSQDYKNGVRFTSLLDPYRGTPYELVDSTKSDWKAQNYGINGRLAYELVPERLSFGLEVSIDVARGAKQIDPRPRTNNSNIEFTPSLSFSVGGHVISVGGNYTLFKENVNLILYNTSESQKIYAFKGLGQYTYDIFTTTERERNYNGSGLGAMFSYRYKKGPFTILFEGLYNNYAEEALDIDRSKLRLRGRFYDDKIQAKLETHYQKGKSLNTLKLFYSDISQSGREIIQIFNPSEDVNNWVTDSEVPQRWLKKDQTFGGEYNYYLIPSSKGYAPFSIQAQVFYTKITESYRVMDTNRDYNSLYAQIAPTYRFNFKKFFTSIQLIGGYNMVSDFDANYKEREVDNNTIKNMYFDYDADILRQSYFKVGADLSCGYSLNDGSAFVLGVNYQLYRSANNLHRNFINASIAYHF